MGLTGYLILAAFIILVFSHFACFITGIKNGRKAAAAEYAEERAIREKDAMLHDQIKQDIKQGVLKDAAEQKANLAGHTDNRSQFDAINASLSNKPKD